MAVNPGTAAKMRCYPEMKIHCTKCNDEQAVWSSRGFPVEYVEFGPPDRRHLWGQIVSFQQRCKNCREPAWPDVNDKVVQKILETIEFRRGPGKGRGKGLPLAEFTSHLRDLCDGCDVGLCRFAPKDQQ